MLGLIHFLKSENYLTIYMPGREKPLHYRGTKNAIYKQVNFYKKHYRVKSFTQKDNQFELVLGEERQMLF